MSCIEATLLLTLYIKKKGLHSLDSIHLSKDGGKWWAVVCWIHLAHDRDKRWVVVNTVM